MAKNLAIRTARITDKQLFDLIYALWECVEISGAWIELSASIRLAVPPRDSTDESMAELYSDRYAIHSASMSTLQDLTISFYRGICDNQDNPHQRQPSPHFDELFLSPSDRSGPVAMAAHIVKCVDVIEEILASAYPMQGAATARDPNDVLQAELVGLTRQYREMFGDLNKERLAIQKEFEERREALEHETDAARSKVEDDAVRQRKELNQQRERDEKRLEERLAQLEQREEAFDDRQHMHARRDLRKQIANKFRDTVGRPIVSKNASVLRILVFFATLIAGGFSGVIAYLTFQEMPTTSGLPSWVLWSWVFRSTVFSILAVGFFTYAIYWLRILYLDDVRFSRESEKYGDDIDRASFVIETILEVGEKENAAVPDAWIEGVCRNLFLEKGGAGSGTLPSNVVSILLDSISGAKVGPEGTELKMGRWGARRLSRKLEQ